LGAYNLKSHVGTSSVPIGQARESVEALSRAVCFQDAIMT
jgi:hypothetical protein